MFSSFLNAGSTLLKTIKIFLILKKLSSVFPEDIHSWKMVYYSFHGVPLLPELEIVSFSLSFLSYLFFYYGFYLAPFQVRDSNDFAGSQKSERKIFLPALVVVRQKYTAEWV